MPGSISRFVLFPVHHNNNQTRTSRFSSVISAGRPKAANNHWHRNTHFPPQAFEDRKHQKTDAGTHYPILRQTQLPGDISEGLLMPQGLHPIEIGMDSIAKMSTCLQAERSTIFD
jgi:hypothetical protein